MLSLCAPSPGQRAAGAPYYPERKTGRLPSALEAMLRIHCMQQWFTLSDLAMEETLFDTAISTASVDASQAPMGDVATLYVFLLESGYRLV